MPGPSRRAVLKVLAGALPALALGCGQDDPEGAFDPEAVPESTTRFPRTPIAGDVTSTRAVLTFHVADDAPVTLRVWTSDGEVVVDEAVAPSGDGFHKVWVDALVPGTAYAYAVFSGEAPAFADRGLIGRFKTPPADDVAVPVRIALMACIGQGTVLPDYFFPEGTPAPTAAPFQWEVFIHAADHDLDALVHLGDQAYLDWVWSEDPSVEAYLHAWGYYHGGGYREIYPLAALYTTWDDHESADNSNFDPWSISAEDAEKLTTRSPRPSSPGCSTGSSRARAASSAWRPRSRSRRSRPRARWPTTTPSAGRATRWTATGSPPCSTGSTAGTWSSSPATST